jgi:predicted membrane channel-forming protein YqfA (hemolysin III family)
MVSDMGWLHDLALWIKAGILSAFGGVVGYLVDVANDDAKEFRWVSYIIFVLCAFFVGQILDDWLPTDMPGRGGVLMVAGTAAYPVLQVMRTRVSRIIEGLK